MQIEEKRIDLFYDITRINGSDCFTLYYPLNKKGKEQNEEELIPIGCSVDFHSQFREAYGEGRPWDMEEQLIRQILRNNPASRIPESTRYSAQLLIDKKPVEGFLIQNFK